MNFLLWLRQKTGLVFKKQKFQFKQKQIFMQFDFVKIT